MFHRAAGRPGVVLGSLIVIAAAAGCTSSTNAPASRSSGPPTSITTSSIAAATAVQSAAPSTSLAVAGPTSAASDEPSAPPAASATSITVAPRSTCTSLTIRVIRGSAAAGREFAALQFTNTGAGSCVLNGYPAVTLLLHGKQIGTGSVPAGSSASSRRLGPGDTAESQLNDYVMNCQAPLSDTIVVRAPGSDAVAQRPVQLRACPLRVSALGAPE